MTTNMRAAICFWVSFFFVTGGTTEWSRAQEQTGYKVTFVVQSPDLPDTTQVYITGSVEQLGSWNPARVKMEALGKHTWRKDIQLQKSVSLEYKFTLGSWAREGADSHGAPLPNFQSRVSADTTITCHVLFWTRSSGERVKKSHITGTVKYHHSLKGEGIASRDLVVWLPPQYETAGKERYPVIYMHDGQNLFDEATSSFGVDWRIDETADSLIRRQLTQPVIVVGIYNTPDRMKEYVPGTMGTAYMNFVANTVKPFIDSAYRTKPDRENTITGGSSAGGILSFMLVWEHPDIFSKAICMSPAFKIPHGKPDDWNYVNTVMASAKTPRDVFFYIDNGGVGLDAELQPGVDEMLAALKTRGYQEGKDFVFIHDVNARHFEADWARRFPKAMMLVLEKIRQVTPSR